MLDRHLRSPKDRIARPITGVLAPWLPPVVLTGVALVAGVTAGALAAAGLTWWALGWWWLSRIADGLDGPVARARGRATDLGGYLDILGDTVVYAAIPSASQRVSTIVASGSPPPCCSPRSTSNAVSWLFLAAVVEKRRAVTKDGRTEVDSTTIVMPSGLIEGTETIVLFSLLLAFPDHAVLWCSLMAVLVGVTVLQRDVWAQINLR